MADFVANGCTVATAYLLPLAEPFVGSELCPGPVVCKPFANAVVEAIEVVATRVEQNWRRFRLNDILLVRPPKRKVDYEVRLLDRPPDSGLSNELSYHKISAIRYCSQLAKSRVL